MNSLDRMLFLLRVVLLLAVLALGLWFTASGLQRIIASPSSLGSLQIVTFIIGLLFFFGGIVTGIVVMGSTKSS